MPPFPKRRELRWACGLLRSACGLLRSASLILFAHPSGSSHTHGFGSQESRKSSSLYESVRLPPALESKSRHSKISRASPSHFSLRQPLFSSEKDTEPLPSVSSDRKANSTVPKWSCTHALKDERNSAVCGSNSCRLMVPLTSWSRWHQAPPMLPRNPTAWHASRNSAQVTRFELSVSRRDRQTRRGRPCDSSISLRSTAQASASGVAESHSVTGHLSSHSRSSRETKPQP
mmetsp:Transcript_3851/g.11261  ORF Transcript_3851/g.11261 Transcript_3851/m.11261 type:complete len:231 (+) Transcript_3851:445-1137(+)